MSETDDLSALTERVRALQDRFEILDLLNSYGPLVDSGSGAAAAALWEPGGGYDFGGSRLEAPAQIADVYEGESWKALTRVGTAHMTSTPVITVDGDHATAVGYTFVILPEGDRYFISRSAINNWTLVRGANGWRIQERTNRAIDGSPASHGIMTSILSGTPVDELQC